MNDELNDILEEVVDATDASPEERTRLEHALLEDPAAFGHRFRAHLDAEQLRTLGVTEV